MHALKNSSNYKSQFQQVLKLSPPESCLNAASAKVLRYLTVTVWFNNSLFTCCLYTQPEYNTTEWMPAMFYNYCLSASPSTCLEQQQCNYSLMSLLNAWHLTSEAITPTLKPVFHHLFKTPGYLSVTSFAV